MPPTRRWLAPAKLNLFLHVVGRRADGYHELQTVFQLIDRCDVLEIAATRDGRIRRTAGNESVHEADDLCIRAALRLQKESGTSRGADIAVEKHVPLGAGLGGGSSDAASTLLALNQEWELGWPLDRLASLGAELGADVPVFVRGHSAWAEGVGERLRPLALPPRHYVVLIPPVHVETARIFADPDLCRSTPPTTEAAFRAGDVHNDLEPVTVRLHPEVGEVLAWLRRHGPAQMTGSGSAVFLPVEDRSAGDRILEERRPEWQGFVARGLDVHPLHTARAG